MRTIIAGSRTFSDAEVMGEVLGKCGWKISRVLCGGARGADALGEEWAFKNNVPVSYFPAQWDVYGKRAGFVRNEEMANKADALVAFWDGESKGTLHMINAAFRKKLAIFVHTFGE